MATSASVPGSMAATGNPEDTVLAQTVMGRCPRCERWTWEPECGGVYGTFVHVGG
jgi:hypothetical protein